MNEHVEHRIHIRILYPKQYLKIESCFKSCCFSCCLECYKNSLNGGWRDGLMVRTRVQLPAPIVQKLPRAHLFWVRHLFLLYVPSDPVLTLNITGMATWFHFHLKTSFNIVICMWLAIPQPFAHAYFTHAEMKYVVQDSDGDLLGITLIHTLPTSAHTA